MIDAPESGQDADQAEQAEAVRAYLVALRGGAPFLSSADARLLLAWLEQGVPVALIMGALDQVAERRRQRRSRGRMSLNGARREVEKRFGGQAAALRPPPPSPTATAALAAWVDEIGDKHGGDAFVAELLAECRAILRRPDGPHALLEALANCCRRFHDAVWESDLVQQAALRDEARAELAPLEADLGAAVFGDLVEEAARSRLRARWPRVCAAELWDRLPASGEHAGR